jgi:hypothetical protein
VTTPVQPRCHLHLPITNSSGDVFPYATITLYDADTGTPVTTNVYVQPQDGNPVSFPLFVDPAIVDLWTDDPVRVQIVAEVSDNVRVVLDGIDIMPPADNIFRAPKPLTVDGADQTVSTAVLMASEPGRASFRVADPVGTHQHAGDSAGSVVLTGEAPTDFNPYQTWVGYHAGENAAATSTASSAYGANAELSGSSSTLLGYAGIVPQTFVGTSGDMATVLSSENGDATSGSTVAGPGNLTAMARDMTVLGGMNTASSAANGSTLIGPGSTVGSSGVVKVGPNHSAVFGAGSNHTVVGPANSAQSNGLPWAGAQTPFALGGSQVSLAGDPSTQTSADDWFGGVSPLAMGTSSTTWSPSIGLIQGNMYTQTALRAQGDVVVNGQRTYSNATTTLGFFGATGTTRPNVPVDSTAVSNTVVDQLMTALANLGLIYTASVPLVYQGAHQPDATPMEFAETGQALQWKLPSASPDYRSTNPFTIASSKVVLNAANGPYPTRGTPAIYSAGRSDVIVQGQFTYNPTAAAGTNAISNYGFETNTTGWQGWDPGVTISRDTTRAKFGDASLSIGPSATADHSRAATTLTTTPGTSMNFSIWVYPQWNHQILLTIDYFDSAWNYLGSNGATNTITTPTLNTWTRINVGGVAPSSTANMACTVGYIAPGSLIPAGHTLNVDGAMLQFGTTIMGNFVDNAGYHPDDRITGLMVRCLHEKSLSGGQTIATTKGYLIGRTDVYSMAGNTITGTVATHSTPVATGQLLQADCNGNSVIVRANGTQISAFTDSTWNTRVKFGYRLAPTTNVSDFLVLPFGF